MYALTLIPYLKWIVILLTILFYGFLYKEKKYMYLAIAHFVVFILFIGQSTYFDLINVSDFKGFYTGGIIDVLFICLSFILGILYFREKSKIYKKMIVGVTLFIFSLVSWYEYFIFSISGFKDPTEKIYKISDRFQLRKEFIDYGRPYPYNLEEDKYLFFRRYRTPMYQISADEHIDSIQVISSSKNVLKLKVYNGSSFHNSFFLLKYDWNGKPYNGLIKVGLKYKQGFVDLKARVVIPLEYDYLEDFNNENICIAHKNGKVGTINTKNEIVKPFK